MAINLRHYQWLELVFKSCLIDLTERIGSAQQKCLPYVSLFFKRSQIIF